MNPPTAEPTEGLLRSLHEAGLVSGDQPRAFQQPWHAQAFALAVALHRAGLFTWPEWVGVLSQQIQSAPGQPDEDPDSAYYRQWLAALEQLVVTRQACVPADIDRYQSAWRRAYLATPHGHPVQLANAGHGDPAFDDGDGHHDDHHHHHDHELAPKPIAISPPLR